ncbi:MAG: PTS sugar transporter subunit IIC [Clostridia bacterium]|nr:PTS sugar transporter subunit IIC [Clostridia bacterium]
MFFVKTLKKILNNIFIDGLSGMALGLFATLIVGTILSQIGTLFANGKLGDALFMMGKIASLLTGAGIGVGVAYKFKGSPLVVISAATNGMIGAYAAKILAGTLFADGMFTITPPGEPLGAFIAAYVGYLAGKLVSGKTKVDILVTPVVSIFAGSIAGLIAGPPISALMSELGSWVNWGVDQQPFLMGIVVSVLMGIFLTLPISSAAIGIVLGLDGLAAGAATVGCCANMIGFAVASYRENKLGGLLSQGLGTSMLQMPNIIRRPLIWLPAIITSAILGPLSTMVFKMTSNPTGSGMGTAGLVGPIMSFQTMSETMPSMQALTYNITMYFVLPAILSLVISEIMRKHKFIAYGDMSLDVQ